MVEAGRFCWMNSSEQRQVEGFNHCLTGPWRRTNLDWEKLGGTGKRAGGHSTSCMVEVDEVRLDEALHSGDTYLYQ